MELFWIAFGAAVVLGVLWANRLVLCPAEGAMAVLIKTDGTSQSVWPKSGEDFSIEELQALVGGYVEFVRPAQAGIYQLRGAGDSTVVVEVDRYSRLCVNEEGKLKGLDANETATMIYGRDAIVGPAVLCGEGEVK